MMMPYLLGGGAIALMLSLGGGYLLGRSDGRALERAEHEQVSAAVELAAQKTREVVAGEIAKIEVKNVYTTQKLERETVEKPVYRECVHSDDAYSLLNYSLTAPEDRQDVGDLVLPEAGTADGQELRGDD